VDNSNIKDKAGIEKSISQSLRSILAVVEQYPDLKASNHFIKLQESLIGVENDLQMTRRYYNGTVRDYNIVVQSFPSNIIAQSLNFKMEEFFEIEIATERLTPKVQIS
jgi:LemA protein